MLLLYNIVHASPSSTTVTPTSSLPSEKGLSLTVHLCSALYDPLCAVPDDKDSSTGVIVGVVIPLLMIILAVVIFIVILLLIRRHRSRFSSHITAQRNQGDKQGWHLLLQLWCVIIIAMFYTVGNVGAQDSPDSSNQLKGK